MEDDAQLYLNYQTRHDIVKKGGINHLYAKMIALAAERAKSSPNIKLSVLKQPVSIDTKDKSWVRSMNIAIAFLIRYDMDQTLAALKTEWPHIPQKTGFNNGYEWDEYVTELLITNTLRTKFYKSIKTKPGPALIPTVKEESKTRDMINNFLNSPSKTMQLPFAYNKNTSSSPRKGGFIQELTDDDIDDIYVDQKRSKPRTTTFQPPSSISTNVKQREPVQQQVRQTSQPKVHQSPPQRPVFTNSANNQQFAFQQKQQQQIAKTVSPIKNTTKSITDIADSYLHPPPKPSARPSNVSLSKYISDQGNNEPELEPLDLDDIDEKKESNKPLWGPPPSRVVANLRTAFTQESNPTSRRSLSQTIGGSQSNRIQTSFETNISSRFSTPKQEEKPSFTSPKRSNASSSFERDDHEPLQRPPILPKETKKSYTLDESSFNSSSLIASDESEHEYSMDELQMMIDGDDGPSTLDSDSIFRSNVVRRRKPSADYSYRPTKRYKDGSVVKRRKNDPLERVASRVYSMDGEPPPQRRSSTLYEAYSTSRRSESAQSRQSSSSNYNSYRKESQSSTYRGESPEERHQRHKEERRQREEQEAKRREEERRRKDREEERKRKDREDERRRRKEREEEEKRQKKRDDDRRRDERRREEKRREEKRKEEEQKKKKDNGNHLKPAGIKAISRRFLEMDSSDLDSDSSSKSSGSGHHHHHHHHHHSSDYSDSDDSRSSRRSSSSGSHHHHRHHSSSSSGSGHHSSHRSGSSSHHHHSRY